MKKVITKMFSIALIVAMVFALGVPAFAYSGFMDFVPLSRYYAEGTVTVHGMEYDCSGGLAGDTSGAYSSTYCLGTTFRYSQVSVTFITDIYGYDSKSSQGAWTLSLYTGTVNSAKLYPTYPNNTTGIYSISGVVGCCCDDIWQAAV